MKFYGCGRERFPTRIELSGTNFTGVYFLWDELSTEEFPVRGRDVS